MKIESVSALKLISDYLKNRYGDQTVAIKFTDYDTDDFDMLADVSSIELAKWALENQATLWKNGVEVVGFDSWCSFVRDVINYFDEETKAELLKIDGYKRAYDAFDYRRT